MEKAIVKSNTHYKISGGAGAPLTEPYKREPVYTIYWIEGIAGLGIDTSFDNYEEAAAIVHAWNKMYCVEK